MKTNKTSILKTALALALALMATVAALHADTFGSGTNAFAIDFVTVGDPGNPDDSGTTGSYYSPYGGVDSVFRIGTFEISRAAIGAANAASLASGSPLGLTLADMAGLGYGTNDPAIPATGLSWNEAARFVNWLNTSTGHQAAYKFSLQPGQPGYDSNANILLWESGDAGYDPSNPFRNSNAHYFLPSEDEWYKAAFYSGGGNNYFDYAIGTDAPNAPTPVSSGTLDATDVYAQPSAQGPAAADQSGGLSHYGVMGMGGNIYEWTESAKEGSNDSATEARMFRGGKWYGTEEGLRSSFQHSASVLPGDETDIWDTGFRVASVPEPSAAVLMLGAAMTCLFRRRRV